MENTRTVIVDANSKTMMPVEGALVFVVPTNPNPKRPTLAHHNYHEEQMEWIRENWSEGMEIKDFSDDR